MVDGEVGIRTPCPAFQLCTGFTAWSCLHIEELLGAGSYRGRETNEFGSQHWVKGDFRIFVNKCLGSRDRYLVWCLRKQPKYEMSPPSPGSQVVFTLSRWQTQSCNPAPLFLNEKHTLRSVLAISSAGRPGVHVSPPS